MRASVRGREWDGEVTALIAALDGEPGPLAGFTGTAGDISRVPPMREKLPLGELMDRFTFNASATAGPGGIDFRDGR
jgi:hypothetical protein